MRNTSRDNCLGFSLVEMAIVLTIVGVLMAGMLPTITAQIEQQRRTENRKLLEEVKDVMIGYAMSNGRLPSPACGTIPTIPGTSNNAGIEIIPASSALCASANDISVLPWITLGVSETDAWGHRLTYRVTPIFASAVTAGSSSAFQLNSLGDMTIKESTTGNTVASTIPFIVISHGVNACGAYMTTGSRIDETTTATFCNDVDHQENSDSNNTFISKTSPTSTFDDFVFWLPSSILVNRMVAVGKLP